MGLLDGTSGSGSDGAFKIQLGADNGQFMTITIGNLEVSTGNTAFSLTYMVWQ